MHSYKLSILEKHLDTFGHVNNATYLELLEEARWDLIEQNLLGLENIKKTGQGPVVLDIHISFVKELVNREEITIHSNSLGFLKRNIWVLEQKIFNSCENLCCRAVMSIAIMDLKKRKLIEIPSGWKKLIDWENQVQLSKEEWAELISRRS